MKLFQNMYYVNLQSLFRDRLIHVIGCVSLFFFLSIPSFSLFSMRQVQELAISLSLSAISATLLCITLLAGSSSIWRDIEKRYTASVLGLPMSRTWFVVGKFCAVATVIAGAGVLMAILSGLAITLATVKHPSAIPVNWVLFATVVWSDILKYLVLLAFTFLFSAISTSFFFPFFTSIAVYMSGSATQEVYEYVCGEYGRTMPEVSKIIAKGLYYLLPNFGAFNLKAYAIYGLTLSQESVILLALYGVIYAGIVLWLAVWSFSRREIV